VTLRFGRSPTGVKGASLRWFSAFGAERVLLCSKRWSKVVVMTAGSATRRTQNGYPAAR
jgi:hypothetical protein